MRRCGCCAAEGLLAAGAADAAVAAVAGAGRFAAATEIDKEGAGTELKSGLVRSMNPDPSSSACARADADAESYRD